MIYWLNRRVERAFESYLRTIVGGQMRVYRSADIASREFPCAVVRAHQNRRFSGETNATNIMSVSVVVLTEYARTIDDSAVVVEEFEEIEERCVSAVLEAVYTNGLPALLNGVGVPGVTISYAALGSEDENPVTSQSDEDGTVSIVEIPLRVMAGATEIN